MVSTLLTSFCLLQTLVFASLLIIPVSGFRNVEPTGLTQDVEWQNASMREYGVFINHVHFLFVGAAMGLAAATAALATLDRKNSMLPTLGTTTIFCILFSVYANTGHAWYMQYGISTPSRMQNIIAFFIFAAATTFLFIGQKKQLNPHA